MKYKKLIVIVIVIAVIGLIIIKLVSNKHTIDQRVETAIQQQVFDVIPVKTYSVKHDTLSNRLIQSGTFSPQQDLMLSAQSQGLIKTLHVKKSQFVTKGTLLVTIDDSGLASQMNTAEATLGKAKLDAQRMKNALASGGVTQQQVEGAELQVKYAQTNVLQLQQMMANYQIVAPVSGVINKIFAEQGSFASPGAPIIQLVDITKLILDISIDQEMIPTFLKMGQKVKVTTDVYPEVVFDGTIETVNVNADASQKIDIGISVENTEEHPIIGGIFGRAEFIHNKENTDISVLAIPRLAIIGSIQDAKVYVVKADSTVTLRTIIVGRTLENNVEVVSGLTEGEEVVTAGQINLEEGTKVIVKN